MIPSIHQPTVVYTNLGDSEKKYPPEQHPALITYAKRREDANPAQNVPSDYEVSLAIFYRTGVFFMENVPYSETFKPGHWSPPKRS